MKRFVYLISILSNILYAQNGYLGHKNSIDGEFSFNTPILSGSYKNKEYKVKGNTMTQKKDWIDYGFSFQYTRLNKKNKGVGLICSMKRYNLEMPSYFISDFYYKKTNQSDTTGLRIESLKYTNFNFGPRFEFISKDGFFGVGLCYDLSFGVNISRIRNNTYAYSINEFYSEDKPENWSEVDYITTSYSWKSYFGIFAQTGFKMRIPLNDNLLINSGFYYTFIKSIKPDSFDENYPNSNIFNAETFFFKVQRENIATITFNIGLSYSF